MPFIVEERRERKEDKGAIFFDLDRFPWTRVVFSRIRSLEPEHAAKIMGLLLIQDDGEKEMIRLAFGPESLLYSVVLRARKELGLIHPPTSSTAPGTPTSAVTPPPAPAVPAIAVSNCILVLESRCSSCEQYKFLG